MIRSRSALICFLLSGVIVIAVLFGWAYDLPGLQSGFTGLSTMKVNTALGLGSLALASCFKNRGRWTACLAIIIAAISLTEDLFHIDFKFDQLFSSDPASLGTSWAPGRPSPVTALNLLFLGFSILWTSSAQPFLRKTAQAFLLISWIIAFQSVAAFMIGVSSNYGSIVFTQMAIHTSITFCLIASGLLISSDEGIMIPLKSRGFAGKISRQLLFFSIVLPIGIFWLQIKGVQGGLWNEDYGVLFRIVSQILFFSWLAFKTGASILASEKKAQNYETVLKSAILVRDNFLSIASHELRTPLTSMKLHLEIAKRSFSSDDNKTLSLGKANRLIASTEVGLNQMVRLVEDMLDIARIEEGKLQLQKKSVNLSHLIRENLERLSPQMATVDISWSFEAEREITAQVDPGRFEQVITNLVTNAVRYAPRSVLKVCLNKSSDHIRLDFRDNGPGIAQEHFARIFERFERIESASWTGGLGLGLFIVKDIVQGHDGKIHVESKLGEGTCFVVELPA